MAEIGIFVGSVYGNAAMVAERAKSILSGQGHQVKIIEQGLLESWLCYRQHAVLVITSTTGQGHFPESIETLYDDLETLNESQPKLQYGVIALGDSNYDDYCEAGKKFDELLQKQGAIRVKETLMIDADNVDEPQEEAQDWVTQWGKALA